MRTMLVALLTFLLATAFAVTTPVASAQPGGYSSELLYFRVFTGPERNQPCTIVGELFVPDGASPSNRLPAILTTNGFGGSYHDQVPSAQMFASLGYVALAYSGLGFGGSTCKISLDAREYDGTAASQLISFLGGADGIAFTDPGATRPRPVLDVVTRDGADNRGAPSVDDPRVGMVGGSYGGGIQFATAAVDPRLDTIVPLITWNDLSYSLVPNGTGAIEGVSTAQPGAAKLTFASLLFADGIVDPGVAGYLADPVRAAGACLNYQPELCAIIGRAVSTGTLTPDMVAYLRHNSVASYYDEIRIPVLLGQGQRDTLFVFNEAAATFAGLKQRGVPVKMIWHSWGHSHLVPAPGEFSLTAPDPNTQYETRRIADWMDHYLRGSAADTGPEFAYFRPWVPYAGNAAPAFATSNGVDVGTPRSLFLSGDRLLDDAADVRPAASKITTAPGGLPTGIEPPDIAPTANIPNVQVPGTKATWTTAPMTSPLDVAGIPTATLRVEAPPGTVVFAQIYDVAPDGTSTLINGLTVPVRIDQPTVPVTLPGFVHRFDTGHSLRFVVSGGNINFRGSPVAVPVTIHSEGSSLQVPVTP